MEWQEAVVQQEWPEAMLGGMARSCCLGNGPRYNTIGGSDKAWQQFVDGIFEQSLRSDLGKILEVPKLSLAKYFEGGWDEWEKA